MQGSGNVQLKDMVERFKVYSQPRRPEGKDEEWLAGERADARDYLLYGRLYIPTGRVDAVYTARLSPGVQALAAAISDPRSNSFSAERTRGSNIPTSNIMLSLQHDTGRTCTEYSWSAEDGMFGVRLLHNFGKLAPSPEEAARAQQSISTGSRRKRVDEEEAMEGGLKGRISAGAEVYFSARERSAGISTGIRFTTLPDATPPSFQLPSTASSTLSSSLPYTPSQPPTSITALFNPMIGHISGAYAASVTRNLSLCSRFDFNVYSYESEWTMGMEWWMRRSRSKPMLEQEKKVSEVESESPPLSLIPASQPTLSKPPNEIIGLVKARASTTTDISLMWEGRLRNMLVSLGVVSNLADISKPIKSIGLELSYFSSDEPQLNT